jgi:hypothetical protein
LFPVAHLANSASGELRWLARSCRSVRIYDLEVDSTT